MFLQQRRGIASVTGPVRTKSVKSYFDLTEVSEEEFNVGFKTALISGLVVEKTAKTLGLALGQFLLRNESGGKVNACTRYPFVEIEFRAEGVANSGETPGIFLRGPCVVSDDGKKIVALPIPLENLTKNLLAQKELRIPLGNKGEGYTVTAKDLYPPGARYWNVVNVKLYNETESLSVDGYEIISLLDQALTLDFAAVK